MTHYNNNLAVTGFIQSYDGVATYVACTTC